MLCGSPLSPGNGGMVGCRGSQVAPMWRPCGGPLWHVIGTLGDLNRSYSTDTSKQTRSDAGGDTVETKLTLPKGKRGVCHLAESCRNDLELKQESGIIPWSWTAADTPTRPDTLTIPASQTSPKSISPTQPSSPDTNVQNMPDRYIVSPTSEYSHLPTPKHLAN